MAKYIFLSLFKCKWSGLMMFAVFARALKSRFFVGKEDEGVKPRKIGVKAPKVRGRDPCREAARTDPTLSCAGLKTLCAAWSARVYNEDPHGPRPRCSHLEGYQRAPFS